MSKSQLDFTIRPIQDSDLDAVLEVYRQCEDFLALGPVAQASAQMVAGDRELSARHGGTYCGIYVQKPGFLEKPGFFLLAGILDYAPEPDGAIFIELLMLAPACREQGLGEAAVDWLQAETQAPVLRAAVQVNNPRAVRFWQRMGFRITGLAALQEDGTTTYPLERTAP